MGRTRRNSSLPELVAGALAAVKEVEAKVKEVQDIASKIDVTELTGDEITVPDIARELGIAPPRARAILRKHGMSSLDGRWPTVVRGSAEHAKLMQLLRE
jgi:hypothetical protein